MGAHCQLGVHWQLEGARTPPGYAYVHISLLWQCLSSQNLAAYKQNKLSQGVTLLCPDSQQVRTAMAF